MREEEAKKASRDSDKASPSKASPPLEFDWNKVVEENAARASELRHKSSSRIHTGFMKSKQELCENSMY